MKKKIVAMLTLFLNVLLLQMLAPMTSFGTDAWPINGLNRSETFHASLVSTNEDFIIEACKNRVGSSAYSEASDSNKEAESFVYSDTKTGASFTVPKNWRQESLSKEREIIQAKFVYDVDATQMILYGSADLWNELPATNRQGLSRADIDNTALSVSDIAELQGVNYSEVSIVKYNGRNYYKTETQSQGDVLGVTISVTMTTLVRIEYGYYYQFQTNMLETNSQYKDFETILSSMEYPTIEGQTKNETKTGANTGNNPVATENTANKAGASGKAKSNSQWPLLLLLDLLITVIIHPVPIWIYRYAIRKQPVAPKKAKKIVIIDAIIVAIVWFMIMLLTDGSKLSFIALFIWSKICYSSLSKGYSSILEYHINLKSCLRTDSYGHIDTFKHDGKVYDRKKYIDLEKEALLKLDSKVLIDVFLTLNNENEKQTLLGLSAANFEAYKQAILLHPDCKGTEEYREIDRERNQQEMDRFNRTQATENNTVSIVVKRNNPYQFPIVETPANRPAAVNTDPSKKSKTEVKDTIQKNGMEKQRTEKPEIAPSDSSVISIASSSTKYQQEKSENVPSPTPSIRNEENSVSAVTEEVLYDHTETVLQGNIPVVLERITLRKNSKGNVLL